MNAPWRYRTRLIQGPPGPAGQNGGGTETAEDFTQPAINSNVLVHLVAGAFVAVGAELYITPGGYYDVVSQGVDTNHWNLKNKGSPGNESQNTTISAGANVLVAGPQGVQGPPGADGTDGTNGTDGGTGPAGPAPSGTGFVACTGGVASSVAITGDVAINPATGVATSPNINGTPGTFGDASHVSRVTTNAKGQVTATSQVAISVDPTLGGSLEGTASSATVKTVDGTGTTTDFGTSGATCPIAATETVLASGSSVPVLAIVAPAATTDGTTWVTAATYTPVANTLADFSISVLGLDKTASPIGGDFYRADIVFDAMCSGSSAPTLSPGTPVAANVRSSGAGSTYAVQIVVSGGNVLILVKGAASTNVSWSVIGQGQLVS